MASIKKDTVILHALPRAPYTPNASPFPIKLETFLRMKKIPYVIDFERSFSKRTHKTPWIEYNGVEVDDSQLCIEYLNRELGLESDPHLSDQDKAIARAFLKLTEENLYWGLCSEAVEDTSSLKAALGYTGLKLHLTIWWLRRLMSKEMYYHGIGRHSPETISQICQTDVKAISDFLGNKPFFMGDEPCEIDCALFGMLSQILWNLPGGKLNLFMTGEACNLEDYCKRMKKAFWPDWDECLKK